MMLCRFWLFVERKAEKDRLMSSSSSSKVPEANEGCSEVPVLLFSSASVSSSSLCTPMLIKGAGTRDPLRLRLSFCWCFFSGDTVLLRKIPSSPSGACMADPGLPRAADDDRVVVVVDSGFSLRNSLLAAAAAAAAAPLPPL
nr:hypothetical protein [uncultured bacterium]